MGDPTKSLQWRISAPTEGQLSLLARYGIAAPDDATRGLVSDMLDHCREEMGPPGHQVQRGAWYDDADFADDIDDDEKYEDDLGPDSHDSEAP